MMNRFFRLILAGFILLALGGCAARPGGLIPTAEHPTGAVDRVPGETGWPTQGWPAAAPAQEGIDPARLEAMQQDIHRTGLALHSLLIIRHGRIVSETYYDGYEPDTLHQVYSITKSVVTTLTGMAVDQGKLAVDQKVVDFFPGVEFANPDPRKAELRVEDLLTMRAGLDWVEGDPFIGQMYRQPDWAKFVLGLPVATQPGTQFHYCSGCSHVLSTILQKALGSSLEDFAKTNLFAPLGITHFEWEKDRQGIPIGGWGLNLTSRDLARLGYLYLHGGEWADQPVVSEGWVQTATSSHTATDGDMDYGYQWWLYPRYGAYAALGRGGQTIFVVPERDLIIVTTADLPNHDPIFRLIDDFIMPAVAPE